MLIMNEITKSYDGIIIIKNISFKLFKGNKIGMIGKNGVGKTTLIKLIMGEEIPDQGSVIIEPHMRIAHLGQQIEYDITKNEAIRKIKDYFCNNSGANKAFIKQLHKEMIEILDNKQGIDTLSGGEKTKLGLLLTLTEDADLYILDEPTNHLDIRTIEALMVYIQKLNKTILIISHDREFLNGTVSNIIEIKPNQAITYEGNYDSYKEQKYLENVTREKAYTKQEREIKHLKAIIEDKKRFYNKAHNSAGQNDFLRSKAKKHVSTIKSTEKKLDKILANKVDAPEEEQVAAFQYLNKIDQEDLPSCLIHVENIVKSYHKPLIEDLSFQVFRGDRIAICGANGTGKTTLIKMLVGDITVDKGSLKKTPRLKVGYFSQEMDNLNIKHTILEEVKNNSFSESETRTILAGFLFRGEAVFKKIKDLSMGEKSRVVFVKLLMGHPNILMLDEITNYMDIISKECLEKILCLYQGTVIFISHDLYFIRNIANRIIEFKRDDIQIFDGLYEEMRSWEERQQQEKDQKIAGNKEIIRNLAMLEYRLVYVNSKLCDVFLGSEEKIALEDEFSELCKEISEIKNKIN
ncbi:ribosomal protection-like ABC-F family protein [Vallitalea okinawensis]|uniref:ribosomal protection-like ABC-F family protein n=1 Tax=Vallitalea okinawensis TaxID=2078660 RepID=UPI000CFB75B9|nr:ABC-F family ATP-binding cassette domain-containing protein [Vallitalea okinawensis]